MSAIINEKKHSLSEKRSKSTDMKQGCNEKTVNTVASLDKITYWHWTKKEQIKY